MEDCFVVFNPSCGFLKAQRWYKSLDEGVYHHGRFPTQEKAISAARLYMSKGIVNYQEIFDSYIINLADPEDQKSPTFILSLVNQDLIKNIIKNLLSPVTSGVSVGQLLINANRVYGSLDDLHTALKWDPRGTIVYNNTSGSSEEAKRIAYAAVCSKHFSNAYSLASPVYVDMGWFVFANPRDAMLFKMACSDNSFETIDLFEVVENIQKETKRYLDKFGTKY